MRNTWFIRISIAICAVFISTSGIFAQNQAAPTIKSGEISDDEGIPVLIKHLPDWENARNRAVYILNQTDLQNALGSRGVLDLVDFEVGTEAVTADYDAGKLLIVEFMTPQSSIDADQKINERLAQVGNSQPIVYRRIGNYNVFVFDASNENAANTLLDGIKYEKSIQWLGEDPFLLKRAQRAVVQGISELFIATTLSIVVALGISVVAGTIVGFLFFYYRQQKRATIKEFSDAGGMTRLNLDGFTPPIISNKLLKD